MSTMHGLRRSAPQQMPRRPRELSELERATVVQDLWTRTYRDVATIHGLSIAGVQRIVDTHGRPWRRRASVREKRRTHG